MVMVTVMEKKMVITVTRLMMMVVWRWWLCW